jgi:hypothetical protein
VIAHRLQVVVAIEDVIHLIGRDAHAGVLNRHAQLPVFHPGRDVDLSAVGTELHGVVDQRAERLRETVEIGGYGGQIRRQIEWKMRPSRCGGRTIVRITLIKVGTSTGSKAGSIAPPVPAGRECC